MKGNSSLTSIKTEKKKGSWSSVLQRLKDYPIKDARLFSKLVFQLLFMILRWLVSGSHVSASASEHFRVYNWIFTQGKLHHTPPQHANKYIQSVKIETRHMHCFEYLEVCLVSTWWSVFTSWHKYWAVVQHLTVFFQGS